MPGQARILARTLFAKLFESDLMPEGLPQVRLLLWSVLLAATPVTGYPLLLTKKYASLSGSPSLAVEFDVDRTVLITLSMLAMGMVGLIVWDGVFPDRRDVRILGVLPIATRTFVIARLAALGRVFVLFAAAICIVQSFTFAMVVAGYGDPVGRYTGFLAHLVAVAAACTFVFCSLVAAQCLLLIAFGRRAAQAVSVGFQVLFAVGLVQLLVFLEPVGRALRGGAGGDQGATALALLPPAWFFALYEALTGSVDAASPALAQLASIATMASAVLAAGLYGATYGHLSRRALEGPAPAVRRIRRRWRVLPYMPGGFASPLRRAIRLFALRTLARSRSHRMMLAIYAGVALAIVLSSAVSVVIRGPGALWHPGISMLSMPLVFQFLLLVGVRAIAAVPCEPKARWIFRACEPASRGAAVTAIRDAMMLVAIVPAVLFAFAQGLIFWSAAAATAHAVFCLAVGTFLAELLVARTNKVPFACTYLPGRSRVFALWPLYLLAFFFYSVFLAAVERDVLLDHPTRLGAFAAFMGLATAALAWQRRRALAALPGLLFEEEDPDALFGGFNLSEGLAATQGRHGGDGGHGTRSTRRHGDKETGKPRDVAPPLRVPVPPC